MAYSGLQNYSYAITSFTFLSPKQSDQRGPINESWLLWSWKKIVQG